MNDSSSAVVVHDGPVSITKRARDDFDDRQIELIKATVAKDCSTAELHLFLEVAARYNLDVFCHEIYAAKMGGKNGGQGQVVCIVGRDGLLKIARRTGEFEGIEGDVVRENDEFHKEAGVQLPKHSYSHKDRGAIVGAWSVVYRSGCTATYFFAPWDEYVPTSEAKLKFSPWSSQKSAMILKCAESMALRKAFSITGVVGEEEMARAVVSEIESQGTTEWGEDPTLAAWLKLLVAEVNDAKPNSYREAKIRAKLKGRSDEEREVFAQQLVDQLGKLKRSAPARPTQDELDAAEAEERGEVVQDAELVEDEQSSDAQPYVPSDPDEIPFPGGEAEGDEGPEGEQLAPEG